jgi:hypothetical protein
MPFHSGFLSASVLFLEFEILNLKSHPCDTSDLSDPSNPPGIPMDAVETV